MIKAINLSKSYGNQTLFDSVNFHLGPGERVGLVGRNGHGKTTLLRMLVDEDHPDSGEIMWPRDYRIGHVTQHLDFTAPTIADEGCRGLPDHHRDERWMVEKVLFGLGFSREDMDRSPLEFSGGFQVRLNLAKVLVSEPNLLLLDEPTNYLDIVSIRWLSNFLKQWKGELILITHDRSFMDSVITHTMGIHRKKIRKIRGSTDAYYEQILKDEEIYEKTRQNDEKKRKESEQFITRFRAKARLAGLVQSRIKALQKHEKMDRLEKIKSLEFSFSYRPFSAKVLARIEDLSFGYGPEDLIPGLSITIGKSDRVCVIGKNGKGKTTLLRLLAGDIPPRAGEIIFHGDARSGYFEQTNTAILNKNLTVEEEIMGAAGDRQKARDIAGAMMFEGDMALKKVAVLSGGEKSRVLLGKVIADDTNLLLLDEPTNHLDMESCDALLAAIDDYPGAAVIVTHNEMFLNTLANRFIIFQGGGISVFEGSYRDFLERVGWDDEDEGRSGISATGGNGKQAGTASRKEIRRQRADILSRKSEALKPLQKKSTAIENEITEIEKTLSALNEEIISASGSQQGGRIEELSRTIHTLQKKADSLYDELESVTLQMEEKELRFNSELAGIDTSGG